MTAYLHVERKDLKDIIRRSAFLGVGRIYGSHTQDVIAKAISDFRANFKITSQVNCKITDNGSNFLKTFKMSSPQPPLPEGLTRQSYEPYEEDN